MKAYTRQELLKAYRLSMSELQNAIKSGAVKVYRGPTRVTYVVTRRLPVKPKGLTVHALAKKLGMNKFTLRSLMREYAIDKPVGRRGSFNLYAEDTVRIVRDLLRVRSELDQS